MSFLSFVYKQLFVGLPVPKTPQTGRTHIITGSNTGLGLEAARHLVHLDAAKVVLAVRDISKGEKAKASLEETSGRKGVVEVWPLDLGSYDSVKNFSRRCQSLERIDSIIENAGIAAADYKLVEDNESTITVNVVSTFLLALLVLPKLRETAAKFGTKPHLTIMSSEVHGYSPFNERNAPDGKIFATLNAKETADMADRYQVSKLLEVFFIRELVKEIAKKNSSKKEPDLIINFVNPGLCKSELSRDSGWGLTIMKLLLARTTEQGSRTEIYGAIEAGVESHGQYLDDCRVGEVAPLVRSEEGIKAQKRVYDELMEKLEKIQAGIGRNI